MQPTSLVAIFSLQKVYGGMHGRARNDKKKSLFANCNRRLPVGKTWVRPPRRTKPQSAARPLARPSLRVFVPPSIDLALKSEAIKYLNGRGLRPLFYKGYLIGA